MRISNGHILAFLRDIVGHESLRDASLPLHVAIVLSGGAMRCYRLGPGLEATGRPTLYKLGSVDRPDRELRAPVHAIVVDSKDIAQRYGWRAETGVKRLN
jgi:hypothetical protein